MCLNFLIMQVGVYCNKAIFFLNCFIQISYFLQNHPNNIFFQMTDNLQLIDTILTVSFIGLGDEGIDKGVVRVVDLNLFRG